MSEYLVFLVSATSVVGFGMLAMRPSEERVGGAALGIILLASILAPLSAVFGAVGDLSGEDIFSAQQSTPELDSEGVVKAAFEAGVASAVADEFSLEVSDIRVYAYGYDFEGVRAERIKIILSGAAAYADSRGIAAFVREGGLGECEVELEFA